MAVNPAGLVAFLGRLALVASSSWFVDHGSSGLRTLRDDLDRRRCIGAARAVYRICPVQYLIPVMTRSPDGLPAPEQ